MIKTIAFINQKGGTGKTTSTVNIGAGLVRLKKRVLVVDLDPQGSLTYSLGVRREDMKATASELIEGKAKPDEARITRDGLFIIPSSLALAETEARIFNEAGREFMLQRALGELRGEWDYILIDCPPSLGLLTLNALVAVREVYVPLEVQALPLQGLRAIRDIVEIVRKRLNPKLEITGVIGTRFDGRKGLHREVLGTIKEHFGKAVFKTVIRENVRLAEAPSHGKDIFAYAPRSHGAEDYLSLCREILNRGNE